MKSLPLSTTDVTDLVRFLRRTFIGRCIQRFITMEGFDRGLALASQALTAMIPLLILASTLVPAGDDNAIADAIIRKFHLTGDSAAAVTQLFSVPPDSAGGLSVASFILLLYSGVSFTRRLQRMYLSGWEREKAGVRGSLFAALGLLALLLEAGVLYAIRALVRHLPFEWLFMFPISALTGLVLWTSVPWLLMNREVHWRRLLAVGGVAAAATSLYGIATAVYMPDLVERYTNEFGLFGITIALIGWLLAIALVLVASAAIGAEFDRSAEPWVVSLKTRLKLYDPALGPTPEHEGATLGPVEEYVSPFLVWRLLENWLIITFAVWVTANVVPEIVVTGGVVTFLWVSLLLGLVNAFLGPVAHLVALPLNTLTLGLSALVVNGLLLGLTAALSPDLSVGGLGGMILGALLISVVATVVGVILSPMRKIV